MVNSRLGLFSAALSRGHPLSRSYGVNLPSSLTTLLPLALGFSPHLPVSVCGTGALSIHMAFLAFSPPLRSKPALPHSFSRHGASPTSLLMFGPFRPGQPTPGFSYLHVSLCLNFGGYGISTVCASATPFGLVLAPGLPWTDEPCPGILRFSAIMIPT